MKEIVIKINGVEYKVKQSFRSLMIFEELAKKKINDADDSITDIMRLFYAILKGCNKTFTFTFDEYIDLMDDNQESLEMFVNYLQEQATGVVKEEPKKKKKL